MNEYICNTAIEHLCLEQLLFFSLQNHQRWEKPISSDLRGGDYNLNFLYIVLQTASTVGGCQNRRNEHEQPISPSNISQTLFQIRLVSEHHRGNREHYEFLLESKQCE